MPDNDTSSQLSAATGSSAKTVLRWQDLDDGMVGKADNSVKHPVVTALTSVVSNIAPGSRILRDVASLEKNRGKYRPFIVVQKSRGFGQAPRIVLVTHFDRVPIAQVDECSQLLAVSLGTVTLPHPLPTSPRILIEPEWTEENSYAIAYPIELKAGRHPTRLTSPKGTHYHVNSEELDRLRAVCFDRTRALATLPPAALQAIKVSYEATQSRVSRASRASNLPSIAENEPATPTAATALKATHEVDEEGFTTVTTKRRASRRGNSRGG
ncbi:hypothetical protein AURDEDRAFT_129946 [Auricularia subglabra TFB-10046 SS5]|nr:hypothetical protein AURDEDRAFT_129946 [Auricularia subglabra TFB-10046 SS5]